MTIFIIALASVAYLAIGYALAKRYTVGSAPDDLEFPSIVLFWPTGLFLLMAGPLVWAVRKYATRTALHKETQL